MQPAWNTWPIGSRVTIRRRLPDGYSDVVGLVRGSSAAGLLVERRTGEQVWVPAEVIALGKIISLPEANPTGAN